jgi:exodeoxyribonuclease V beta subunit
MDWFAAPVPETEIPAPYIEQNTAYGTLFLPTWSGKIDNGWRIASYSSLVPHGGNTISDWEGNEGEEPVEQRLSGIFAFPSGARTGSAWHGIFESVDFTVWQQDLPRIAEENLARFGLLDEDKEKRIALTVKMAERVMGSPLTDCDGNTFMLSQIKRSDRISEMEFHFAIRHGFRPETLCIPGEPYASVDWNALGDSLSTGFMNGFIDLIFRWNGHFYIADWKSNRLGGTLESFQPQSILEAMREQHYILQSLIYSVALVKFLRLRNGSFSRSDYERLFGGVCYLFLRGMSPDAPGRGTWQDRPPYDFLMQLEQAMEQQS